MAETATETKLAKYVVMVDAVVITTGKKPNGRAEYTRVLKGGTINGNPEAEQIQHLLRSGSIERATSKAHMEELIAKPPLTARELAARSGAPDDPVQPPQESVQPARFNGGEGPALTPISEAASE